MPYDFKEYMRKHNIAPTGVPVSEEPETEPEDRYGFKRYMQAHGIAAPLSPEPEPEQGGIREFFAGLLSKAKEKAGEFEKGMEERRKKYKPYSFADLKRDLGFEPEMAEIAEKTGIEPDKTTKTTIPEKVPGETGEKPISVWASTKLGAKEFASSMLEFGAVQLSAGQQRELDDLDKKIVKTQARAQRFKDRGRDWFARADEKQVAKLREQREKLLEKHTGMVESSKMISGLADRIEETITDEERAIAQNAQEYLTQGKNWKVTDLNKLARLGHAMVASASESAPMTAASVIPYAGQAAMVASEGGRWAKEFQDRYGEIDADLLKEGSTVYGIPSGLIETYMNRFLLKPLKLAGIGKSKALQEMIDKARTTAFRKMAKGVGRILGSGFGEGFEEVAQGSWSDAVSFFTLGKQIKRLREKGETERADELARLGNERLDEVFSTGGISEKAKEFFLGAVTGTVLGTGSSVAGKGIEVTRRGIEAAKRTVEDYKRGIMLPEVMTHEEIEGVEKPEIKLVPSEEAEKSIEVPATVTSLEERRKTEEERRTELRVEHVRRLEDDLILNGYSQEEARKEALRLRNAGLSDRTLNIIRTNVTDDLTEIPNKRAYRKRIERMEAESPDKEVGVIFSDLDFFKQYQDEKAGKREAEGLSAHEIGDQALKKKAEVLERLRDEFNRKYPDANIEVHRTGGDEFVTVTDNPDIALDFAKRLQTEMLDAEILKDDPDRVSASIGVATGTLAKKPDIEADKLNNLASKGTGKETIRELRNRIAYVDKQGNTAYIKGRDVPKTYAADILKTGERYAQREPDREGVERTGEGPAVSEAEASGDRSEETTGVGEEALRPEKRPDLREKPHRELEPPAGPETEAPEHHPFFDRIPEKISFEDETTPADITGQWDELMAVEDDIRKDVVPKVRELRDELEGLKIERGKEANEKKKRVRQRIEDLEAQADFARARAETLFQEAQEELEARILPKLEEAGITGESDQRAAMDEIAMSLTERPYIERTWNKKVSEIVDDVIEEYGERPAEEKKETPVKEERKEEPIPEEKTKFEAIKEKLKKAKEKQAAPESFKLQSAYTTEGETEKDISDYGSMRPEKNFKADLVKFKIALNSILGWEPETDKKGKDISVETNVAPAGGDGHILLWKPGSELGIYVSVNADRVSESDNLELRDQIMYRATAKKDKWKGKTNRWIKATVTPQELAELAKQEIEYYEAQEKPKEEKAPAKTGFQTGQSVEYEGKNFRVNKTVETQKGKPSLYLTSDLESPIDQAKTDKIIGHKLIHKVGIGKELEGVKELKKAPEKYSLTGKEKEHAEPLVRPSKETLEGTPAQAVRGAGKEREAARGPGKSHRPDKERTHRPSSERAPEARSVGAGERKVSVPAERRRHAEPGREPTRAAGTRRNDGRTDDRNNYHITEADQLGKGGLKQKYARNVEAIRTLKRIESENRLATAEEQAVLVKYVGWGSLPKVFDEKNHKDWEKEFDELKELLTPEEYNAARLSTINAHYTSPTVITAMWDAIRRMGFTGGHVLEPAMGVGHFFGLSPQDLNITMTGIELDDLTGRIARQLYQGARIEIKGFEEHDLQQGRYRVAISNVPFSDKVKPFDPNTKKYGLSKRYSLHDFFFLKALYGLEPGGVSAFITSRYTMDKADTEVRELMANQADFLGAIRLPNTAFKENAGTEVVTDIIFLQKREPEKAQSELTREFIRTRAVQVENKRMGGTSEIAVNSYYSNHPGMVLGIQSVERGMYSDQEYTVNPPEGDLRELLYKAIENLPANIISKLSQERTDALEEDAAEVTAPENIALGGFFTDERGRIYQKKEGGIGAFQFFNASDAKRIRGMIGIRDAAKRLFKRQLETETEEEIRGEQKELNRVYDAFVKRFGYLTEYKNQYTFQDDPESGILLSLEDYDKTKKTATKSPIFFKRTLEKIKVVTSADSPKDAMLVCLNETGALNFERMAELTGKNVDEIRDELLVLGHIFRNPEGGQFETSDTYLTGNIRYKLRVAQKAAQANPDQFRKNVEALKNVMPRDLQAHEITIRMNSPVLEEKDISDFIVDLLDARPGDFDLTHSREMGKWYVAKSRYSGIAGSTKNTQTYGIPEKPALEIIDALLNHRRIQIRENIGTSAKPQWIVKEEETAAANEKADQIQRAFNEWIWKEAERTKRLVAKYNEEYNCIVNRKYDGSHLSLPGLNKNINLRKHQADAVWRVIQSKNTMLAHVVGAGKTLEMICSAMELKRLGLKRKPMFVVPNHMIEQWKGDFMYAYPQARILVASDRNFKPKQRRVFMNRIATGEWDAVIIKKSNFLMLPMSKEYQAEFLKRKAEKYKTALRQRKKANDQEGKKRDRTVKELEARVKGYEEKIKELQAARKDAGVVPFEQLGVDMLFVDEADLYKNVDYSTQMQNVVGLGDRKGNQTTMDMQMKVAYLQSINNGGGIVFATGTPISNTMAEMYHMMRYLQPDVLEAHGLHEFDEWANMFGEAVTSLELNNTGSGYKLRTRFSKFVNVPELMSIIREAWDIQTADMLEKAGILVQGKNLPFAKRETVSAPLTPLLKSYRRYLEKREALVKTKKPGEGGDNVLVIINDGQMAAIDPRLINPTLHDDPGSKLNLTIAKAHELYRKCEKEGLTGVIFYDKTRPGRGKRLDVYAEIKKKLVEKGVRKDHVAFIHDYDTDAKKQALFEMMNAGDIRILIGNTQKMGAGTNIQKRLKWLIHLDAPWRPRDIEQREGRIVRQGNDNKEVEVYYMVSKGTLDAGIWALLGTKAKTIGQVMSGEDTASREVEDAGIYESPKMLAVEDPLIRESMELRDKIKKLTNLERAHIKETVFARQQTSELPGQIKKLKQSVPAIEKDIEKRGKRPDKFSMTIQGTEYTERKDAGELLLNMARTAMQEAEATSKPTDTGHIGTYAGFPVSVYGTASLGEFPGAAYIQIHGETVYNSLVSDSPVGTTVAMTNLVFSGLDGKLKAVKHETEKLEKQLEENRKLAEKPFEKKADLEAAIKREREVQAALEKQQREAPPEDVVADEWDWPALEGERKEWDPENNVEPDIDAEEPEEEVEKQIPKTAKNVNDFIEDFTPPMGLSLKIVAKRQVSDEIVLPEELRRALRSESREVEERWQKAKGAPKESALAKALRNARELKESFTRHFHRLDPKTDGAIIDILRLHEAVPAYSRSAADAVLRGITAGLGPRKYEVFSRVIILADLMKDIEHGMYSAKKLPFGYESEEQVELDFEKFNSIAQANPDITKALRSRKEFMQTLKRDLVKHGFLHEDTLKDDAYFHHQVLEFLRASQGAGVTSKDVRTHRKGWQIARVGSAKDYNTEYIEAEYQVIAQSLTQLETAATLDILDRTVNIGDELRKKAKASNLESLKKKYEGLWEKEGKPVDPLRPFKRKIAFANAKLAEMAANWELDFANKYNEIVEHLIQTHQRREAGNADFSGPAERWRPPGVEERWFEFLSYLLDNNLPGANWAGTIFKAIHDREATIKEELGAKYVTYKSLVPEDYALWQPKIGNVTYRVNTLTDRIVEQVLGQERQLDEGDIKQALALGPKLPEWVIPKRLAETLDGFHVLEEDNKLWQIAAFVQNSWKQWVLLNPLRMVKYNINNLSGDLDIALAYNPAILKEFSRAAKDLIGYNIQGKALDAELQLALRYGVIDSGLTIAEIPEISEAGVFRLLTGKKPNAINRYWGNVRNFTTWRENILRLAAYRWFKNELRKGKKLYGASKKDEIDKIADMDRKAAKLSRELIGDYGNISKSGQWLRKHVVPFYSWIEINAPRYYRLLKNLPHEEGGKGKKAVAGSIAFKTARRIPVLLIKANILYTLISIWNKLFFPDEDREMLEARRELHLILGRDEDGTIRSIRFQGALQEMLDWAGLSDWPADIADIIKGRDSVLEKLKEVPESFATKIINVLSPAFKLPVELAAGITTWPRPFPPRPLRDRWEHLFGSLSLDGLYRFATGKPIRNKGGRAIESIFLYRTDIGQSAYFQALNMKREFLEDRGVEAPSVVPTDRSNMLFYYKQAKAFKDERAAKKYWQAYTDRGGDIKGMIQSLRMSHPVNGLPAQFREPFLKSLDAEQLETLEKGLKWFYQIYTDGKGTGWLDRIREMRKEKAKKAA